MTRNVGALHPQNRRPFQRLLATLARLRFGCIELRAPDGRGFSFPGTAPGPDAVIYLQDWDVAGEILGAGNLGLAETYLQGRWHTPDLSAVLTVAALNRGTFGPGMSERWWGRWMDGLRRAMPAARRNVHSHYDLGNEFYRRWLDRTMTYSSANFDGDWSRSLEDAQVAKYERVLQLVNPKAGERMLEIGCGFGGFAEYAARTRGCRVHAITVSRKQLPWVQERIQRSGLQGLITAELRDFRAAEGSYDHVVSIEMYEAVGERFWPQYFDVVAQRLKRGGRAVLQAIVIADELFDGYRRSTDFIREYIYPRGLLASPSVFAGHAGKAGLAVRAQETFGADYAETLSRWQRRFDRAWQDIHAVGLDMRFKRLWNFYLAYCEAGFRAGTTDVMRVQLTHV